MTIPTEKIRKYILPNMPYAMMFWFSTKVGEAYRLAQGGDFLKKLINSVETLGPAISHPLPSFNPFDLCVGIAGAAAVYLLLYVKKKNAKKWRKDVEYGSARWGTREDIQPYMDAKPSRASARALPIA